METMLEIFSDLPRMQTICLLAALSILILMRRTRLALLLIFIFAFYWGFIYFLGETGAGMDSLSVLLGYILLGIIIVPVVIYTYMIKG